MGGRRRGKGERPHTLPPSPSPSPSPSTSSSSSSSSSSSDFEFSISISPQKSSTFLCPADELFYKGQILPLHLSPRITMLNYSSSSSSTSSISSAPRDSSSSHYSFASDLAFIPDSNEEDYNDKKPSTTTKYFFSFSTFSSVKRVRNSAREVIKKYVKPLYHKLWWHKQQQPRRTATESDVYGKETETVISHSFSGNVLRYPLQRRSCVSSCPSSLRSSPNHSGVPSRGGFAGAGDRVAGGMSYDDTSTMEELQSAIQGAIAHCKSSLIQNKTMVSDEI